MLKLTDNIFLRTRRSHSNMKTRCNNLKFNKYQNYAGRGILVCERWNSFLNFLEDMGIRPEGKTLDRVNNNLGYFKENCRWATIMEQSINKREYKRTVSNLPGVRVRKNGTFSAQITISGRKIHLGTFKTEQEASARFLEERSKRISLPEKTVSQA